ncbi:MAG: heavy-metal-associated domain-containing protein [Castellaniella sp.]|uniref:heavy-metal-associated domain-containing protein n=1 Tax=Castellaniella sp. TaxID=1955812 RepID=UPI003C70CD5F
METAFLVSDMTCNHCVQTITKAVQAVAPDAQVSTDLNARRVVIASTVAADVLRAAIVDEGYDVQAA